MRRLKPQASRLRSSSSFKVAETEPDRPDRPSAAFARSAKRPAVNGQFDLQDASGGLTFHLPRLVVQPPGLIAPRNERPADLTGVE